MGFEGYEAIPDSLGLIPLGIPKVPLIKVLILGWFLGFELLMYYSAHSLPNLHPAPRLADGFTMSHGSVIYSD